MSEETLIPLKHLKIMQTPNDQSLMVKPLIFNVFLGLQGSSPESAMKWHYQPPLLQNATSKISADTFSFIMAIHGWKSPNHWPHLGPEQAAPPPSQLSPGMIPKPPWTSELWKKSTPKIVKDPKRSNKWNPDENRPENLTNTQEGVIGFVGLCLFWICSNLPNGANGFMQKYATNSKFRCLKKLWFPWNIWKSYRPQMIKV